MHLACEQLHRHRPREAQTQQGSLCKTGVREGAEMPRWLQKDPRGCPTRRGGGAHPPIHCFFMSEVRALTEGAFCSEGVVWAEPLRLAEQSGGLISMCLGQDVRVGWGAHLTST